MPGNLRPVGQAAELRSARTSSSACCAAFSEALSLSADHLQRHSRATLSNLFRPFQKLFRDAFHMLFMLFYQGFMLFPPVFLRVDLSFQLFSSSLSRRGASPTL